MESKIAQYYEFGEFRLDARRRTLHKNEEKMQITARLFDLLLVLVQNEGKILEHDELLEKVWGETFVEQSNLKKGISSLRQILGELPNESVYIKTIPRRGYTFIAPVRAAYAGEISAKSEPEIAPDVENAAGAILTDKQRDLPATDYVHSENPNAEPQIVTGYVKTNGGKKWILVSVAVISLLIIASVLWLWRGHSENFLSRLNPESLQAQKFTTGGNIYESGISRDGKAVAYAQVEDNGTQSLWIRRIGIPNSLQIVAPEKVEYQSIVFSPDNGSVYYTITVDNSLDILNKISILGGQPRKLTEGIRSPVTFSPDGKRFAFVRDMRDVGRSLFIADAEDGDNEQKIATVTDNHTLISPQWSPDGTKFVFIASENTEKGRIWELKEMPASGGDAHLLTIPQRGKIYTVGWLQDGSGLLMSADVSGLNQSQLWRVSYPNGEINRLTNDISNYETIDLSADGETLLTKVSERTGDLWSMDAATAANPKRLTTSQNIFNRFVILPDGKFLVEAVENGQLGLYLCDLKGNLQPFAANGASDRNPALSPDGQKVYFVSRRTGSDEIWQADLNGTNPKQLTDEKSFLALPCASVDGQFIYFLKYENTRYLLLKVPVSGGASVAVSNESVDIFDLSPDGKFAAYNFRDETKKRWQTAVMDLSSGAVVRQFDISPSSILRWSGDGKSLFYTTSDVFREGGNLWQQTIDENSPKLFLNAEPDKIYSVNPSADNKQIYFTRGKTVSNLVLLRKEK